MTTKTMKNSDWFFILGLPIIFFGALIFGAIIPLSLGINNPIVMLLCFWVITTFGIICLYEDLF